MAVEHVRIKVKIKCNNKLYPHSLPAIQEP